MSAAVRNKPNLWYVHSPLNELWQFKDYIRENILAPWKRIPFDIWTWANRKLTRRYAKHVGKWVCNSENTRGRILKFYGEEAEVICPPVDVSLYGNRPSKGYWLSVNRLITHKRIEIQMEAFARLPEERLVLVGSYEKGARQFEEYRGKMESIRPQNVGIRSWVSDSELRTLYAECKGFITTARDEDFGMTAVEAMASGKPVIAPREGGYRESVIDGRTGALIDAVDARKLELAIRKINAELEKDPDSYRDACRKQAEKFDTKIFISKIRAAISSI